MNVEFTDGFLKSVEKNFSNYYQKETGMVE